MRCFKIGCLILFLICPVAFAQPKPLNIALFTLSSEPPQGSYWWDVVNFARASADGLGMHLQVFYNTGGSRQSYANSIKSLLNSPNKPDALLAASFRKEALTVIKLAEQYQVPLIMFNNDLPSEYIAEIGQPRSKYKYFIGQIKPDDLGLSFLLANYLISQVAQSSTSQIDIVGISGNWDSPEAKMRNLGLIAAAATHANAKILQIVNTNWSSQAAYRKANLLIKRHEQLKVIWCASDLMALSSLKAINEQGKHIVTGGIDWTTAAIHSIKQGKLAASAGGHFMTAGYGLVLLFDYLHGNDFGDISPLIIETPGGIIHRDNVDKYFNLLTNKDWSTVDFSKYSRTFNPNNTRYDFSFERLKKR